MKIQRQSLFFLLLMATMNICAQDNTVKKLKEDAGKTIAKDVADTTTKEWKKGGLLSLNLAQTSLSNWAAGGDNFSLSLNSVISLFAFYKKGKHSWDNTLDFNLGYIKTTSLGSRKNDDRLDILSKYGYAIAPKWNIAGLFNFRSQLFKGYTYPSSGKTFSSAFLSPAYVLLSAGLDYKPNDHFSVFISPVTGRLTILKDDSLSARGLYGVPVGEHHHMEFGAFLTANYIKDLNKILSYKGRLDLFSNYANNPQNIDIFFSNLFAARISKWLNVTWALELIYDDDIRIFGTSGKSPATQLKSQFGLGVQLKLLSK